MGVDTIRRDGALCVELSGELDIGSAAQVESRLLELEDGGASERIVIDLRSLGFLDSSGLSLLINADRRARAAGRRLTVVSGNGVPRRILTTSGVDRLLDTVEDLEPGA
ncbi:MAG: STAS domain-containing protein [Actinobacteria bacterium]|nr:STAS domain-containing protein [Actinomycetota bacterium]